MIDRQKLIERLTGAWVGYDQLPYQMATPEYDRLRRDVVMISGIPGMIFLLDAEAAADLVDQCQVGCHDVADLYEDDDDANQQPQ